MSFAIGSVPVSPMRKEPSHRAEMVSQLVFGESCRILETGPEQWVQIQCIFDNYTGWCQQSHLSILQEGADHFPTHRFLTQWANKLEFNGEPMLVPFGSLATGFESGSASWGQDEIRYLGDLWDSLLADKSPATLKALAYQYLNSPYLWGGKTVFGTDCSGFTQSIFRLMNVKLLRDAWQQAEQGAVVDSLQEARCGDLAFFDNEAGRITHVGILFSPSEIIHASGKVRVDSIDPEGILHRPSNQRTHHLCQVRRYY